MPSMHSKSNLTGMTGFQCPWNFLASANVHFCEQSLCSWIREPGNTWSNIVFLVVGVILWKRTNRAQDHHLRWIGITSSLTSVGSAFFHASGSLIGGGADYLGMFLSTGLLTAYNSRRWLKCSFSTMYAIFLATTLALMVLVATRGTAARYIYAFGAPCCLIELRLFFRDRRWISYKNYLYSWALVGFAFLFWWLDISKTVCDPNNHIISGHALWHILAAVSFLPLYRYYEQFKILKSH